MSAGENQAASSAKSLATRYAPFIAIAALQLVLVTVNSKGTSTVKTTANTGEVQQSPTASGPAQTGELTPSGSNESAQAIPTGGIASTGGGGGAAAATSGAKATSTQAATAQAGVATAKAAAQAAQSVDTLGRPTSGDKSKCAPGGLLQENVTSQAPPCMPKFEGDNGGATAPGVTGDTITIVVVHPHYPQGVAQALQAGGLEASDDQYREFIGLEEQFFNKHYEFYGRKIKAFYWPTDCADPACFRADAKAMVAKYHPFMATWYTAGIAPEPYMDQLTQLGVVNAGVQPLSDSWFKSHAPYAWDLFPQGNRQAEMLGDYYCKKMWGQNATRAGDPVMQVKKRKLGIITTEDPPALEVAQAFKKIVTGGECGSEADGTTIYTMSSDTTTQQNQYPTLVTRMKNDGITTRASVGGVPGRQEDDKQQYFPENLMSFASDADIVGRLFMGLYSPNQMAHVFGIGWLQKSQPIEKQDFYLGLKDVNPSYDPPRIAQGSFYGLSLFADMLQWAGPKLTPKTVEAGAHSSPQIGGWANPTPWAGWKCCNPYVNEYKLGINANSYTAKVDAKEEYWDPQAISGDDNQPGAFVCVDPNCRRYEPGQWQKGEALKA